MTFLKKLACAAAIAISFAGNANATTFLTNWVFNPVGGGFADGQPINEYLDINGNAFMQIHPTGGTGFTFTQHGVFNILQADSNGQHLPSIFPGGNITLTLEASGTGSFGGALDFSSGTLRMYQNPVNGQYATSAGIYGANLGKEIGVFQVAHGSGENLPSDWPSPNGQVFLYGRAAAGSLDAGYFFREDGSDLSQESALLEFSFTNASTTNAPWGLMVDEVACQFARYTGDGCNGQDFSTGPDAFFLSNNGQVKLVDIPEPASLALFGIAMLGAVAGRRRVGRA